LTSPALTLSKIDALTAAIAGDKLTADQIKTLESCLQDYRFVLRLGNGFRLSRETINELVELVYDDVPYMVGERKKRAIRILNAAGVTGFRVDPVWPRTKLDEHIAPKITEEEIAEAVYG